MVKTTKGHAAIQPKNPPHPSTKAAPAIEYLVQLEDGVWLAKGDGDPARTTRKENAARFSSLPEAEKNLLEARQFRPFKAAKITGVEK